MRTQRSHPLIQPRGFAWLVALAGCTPSPTTWRDAVPHANPNAIVDVPSPSPRQCSASFGPEDDWKPWTSPEVRRALETRLSSLRECGKTLHDPAKVKVGMRIGTARVEHVEIRESTTDDCRALECMRRGLLDLDVSKLPDHVGHTLTSFVQFSRDATPAISVSGIAAGETREAACVDPTPTSNGRMSPEAIQGVIRSHVAGFRHCYQGAFAVEPDPRGEAMMNFTIGVDGHVPRAIVTTTGLADCRVAACLRDELAQSDFPMPEGGGVDVRYPLRFKPGNTGRMPDEAAPETPTATIPPLSVSAGDDPNQCVDHTGIPAPTAAREGTDEAVDASTSGRLPPELIQSIVRDQYDKFRHCYEAGLGRNPQLTGRVGIRFVIARDGRVSRSSVTENTLTDCMVATCVRDAFRSLSFPPPEGGTVTVVYPIMLEPG